MDIVSRVLLRYAQEKRKADYDYIYDPEHKNRPHGGGQWYKTPRGWSNVEHEIPSQTKKERTPNDWMESTKNLNSTGKERVYDYATRSRDIVNDMKDKKNHASIYDMIKTSPRIRRNIIDQLEKAPEEIEETFDYNHRGPDDWDEVSIPGFRNSRALELGGMLANYYGKRDTDFGYFEDDVWEDNRLTEQEQDSLSDEDKKEYDRLNRIMERMNEMPSRDDEDYIQDWMAEHHNSVDGFDF